MQMRVGAARAAIANAGNDVATRVDDARAALSGNANHAGTPVGIGNRDPEASRERSEEGNARVFVIDPRAREEEEIGR